MLPVLCPPPPPLSTSVHPPGSSSGCLYLCFPEPLFFAATFFFFPPPPRRGDPPLPHCRNEQRRWAKSLCTGWRAWKEARGRGTLTLGEPTYAKKARLGWYPPTVYTYWCLPSFKVAKRGLLRPWTWLDWGSAIVLCSCEYCPSLLSKKKNLKCV